MDLWSSCLTFCFHAKCLPCKLQQYYSIFYIIPQDLRCHLLAQVGQFISSVSVTFPELQAAHFTEGQAKYMHVRERERERERERGSADSEQDSITSGGQSDCSSVILY